MESAERTLVAALLHQIDPRLIAHLDRAIDGVENLCEDLAQGKDHATVVKNATSRFDDGDASVGQATAEKIVATIEPSSICEVAEHPRPAVTITVQARP
ncbi:hypothetical protein [Amycolatopsis sp. NPDC051903]|uniref:hypothetical protein n=1 Tax=Amycolatopsis sp. NPDC051903 TaxID=3363936 RepID=UPI003788C9DF